MEPPRRWLLRILAWSAIAAGPGSIAASALLLLLNREAFRHGPGVPTAGAPEAWGLIWVCLGLLAVGHLVSVPASLVWAAARWKRRERLGVALGLSVAYTALVALPLLVWLLLV
jgi:hypothetical protein